MEETKELQTTYKIFRYLIYLSLIVEFFEYAINPELLDYWGGILCDIHDHYTRKKLRLRRRLQQGIEPD